jgi:hypothetical protein
VCEGNNVRLDELSKKYAAAEKKVLATESKCKDLEQKWKDIAYENAGLKNVKLEQQGSI